MLRLGQSSAVAAAIAGTGLLVVLAVVVLARREGERSPAGTTLEQLGDYGRVPPFTLTERSGRRITLGALRGLVWVADFVYTECTESCPLQSLELGRLQDEFADASDLRLVSITVDPGHDTPDVLRRYAERYRAGDHWWFLTGDKAGIYSTVSPRRASGSVSSIPRRPRLRSAGKPSASDLYRPGRAMAVRASSCTAPASFSSTEGRASAPITWRPIRTP